MHTYATEIEDLTEAFKRALLTEGFPEPKAQELTVEKAVEVCRNAAHSDIVKSVLAAAKFETAKEVVSKFITETDTNRTERQVLALRKFQTGTNRHSNGPFRGNGRGHYQGRGRNFPSNFNRNDQSNRNQDRGQNNRQYYNRNGRNWNQQNNRGFNAQGQGNNSGRYNRNQRPNQQQNNIRVTQSGNGEDPRQLSMGGPQMQSQPPY